MNQFINNNKSSGWRKKEKIKIVAGILALVLFAGVLNLFSSGIRNVFNYMTLPLQRSFNNSGKNTAGILGAIFNYKGILQENNNLKEENQRLLAQMSNFRDLSEQDQAVKDILACSQQDSFKLLLANVTGIDPSLDFITIDKGKDDGVTENMAIISQQKVLFGKVFKVYKNFSQAMLISNKNSVLDVKVQNSDLSAKSVLGAVKGKGSFSIYLDLVPTDLQINSGEVLTTSGLEGTFPKDLLVGKINSKNKNDLKPFQTASVNPFFDIKNIDKLFIITNYMKK